MYVCMYSTLSSCIVIVDIATSTSVCVYVCMCTESLRSLLRAREKESGRELLIIYNMERNAEQYHSSVPSVCVSVSVCWR